MASEAVVRRVIGVEGAEALIEITHGAWQDYLDEAVTRYHRTTRANVVWDYMAKRSDAVLGEMDGVERTERLGRPLFVLRDRLVLRPKLHSDSSTRNYRTASQVAAEQLGQFPEMPYAVISFGYQLDRAEAGISDFLVTSPSESWIINLEELAAGDLRPATPLLPGLEEEDLDAIVPIRYRRAG